MTTYTAAQAIQLANQGQTGLAVVDTAANTQASLDALEGVIGNISSVTLSLPAPGQVGVVTVAPAQLTNDSAVISKLIWQPSLYSSNRLAISASLTLAQAIYAEQLNGNFNGLAVVDTAAGVQAALNNPLVARPADTVSAPGLPLSSVGYNFGINLTDTGTPTITLPSSLNTNSINSILASIRNPYNIVWSTGSAPTSISATQAGQLASQGQTAISVMDTASNVASNFDALQSVAASGKLSSIIFTDVGTPALAITPAQYIKDSSALLNLSGAYSINIAGATAAAVSNDLNQAHVTSVSNTDSAANVGAFLDPLQTQAAAGKLTSISLTDAGTPTINIAATQLTPDATALGIVAGNFNIHVSDVRAASALSTSTVSHVASMSILDSAANIVANLDTLNVLSTQGKINEIDLTDSGTPTLTLTAAQQANDISALSKIYTAYNTVVSGQSAATSGSASVASVTQAYSAGSLSAPAAVNDWAAFVAQNIDTLNTMATAGKLSSISLQGGGTPFLIMTVAQLNQDSAALNKIVSPYAVAVKDWSAYITANIGTLETLATTGKLSEIVLLGGGTPNFILTAAQIAQDGAALNAIVTPHVLAVYDSAANVAANIDMLQTWAAAGKLSAVTLTDSSTPTLALSATQVANDTTVLSDILSPHTLVSLGVVTGAEVIGVPSVHSGSAILA